MGKLELLHHSQEFTASPIGQNGMRSLEKPIPAIVLGGRIGRPFLVAVKSGGAGHRESELWDHTREVASERTLTCPTSEQSRGGLLVRRFEDSTADLIFFDRDEERSEVALAKSLIALALNEFEEDRADQIS